MKEDEQDLKPICDLLFNLRDGVLCSGVGVVLLVMGLIAV